MTLSTYSGRRDGSDDRGPRGRQTYVFTTIAEWLGRPLSREQLREIEEMFSQFVVEQRAAWAASTTVRQTLRPLNTRENE